MEFNYDFKDIESRWQEEWEKIGLFKCDDDQREKMYCLTMYPYPSGALHMGHVLNYTIGDAIVRYNIMNGKAVLTPMGWDSFGLPAENAAINANIKPEKYTKQNIAKMRMQIKQAGWGYDWNREIATSNPEYYKWTQWLFLRFYEKNMAYRKLAPVNWCPNCKTVLANEQVYEGHCERCGSEVTTKNLNQWFFYMSSYAQRLLDGHKKLEGNWPNKVLRMQKKWIGRSEGAKLDFILKSTGESVSVFTTRPDTVYGVTFMSIAPEHPLIDKLLYNNPHKDRIKAAVAKMRNQSKIERSSEKSEKEGIFTGHYLINPFNNQLVQLWAANYALMEYGTGAVMGVPAHDQRDFLFAKKYNLPIKVVIQPEGKKLDPETMEAAYEENGIQVNSSLFNGMDNQKAIYAITEYAKKNHFGEFNINYRLRDWLLSRQRYWGAPIPVVHCKSCGIVPVPEKDLPVLLPDDVEFLPTGESPLERCESWQNVNCPACNNPAKRETDTMDTFVDSSWYFLRYLAPGDARQAFDKKLAKKWLPVDLYIGGIEHATIHLIYARFFTRVLYSLGMIDVKEPFKKLFCQGMICKTAYWCPEHLWTPEEELNFLCQECGEVHPNQTDLASGSRVICKVCNGFVQVVHTGCEKEVKAEMAKMSKTKKNGVSPDELFRKYGADAVRVGVLRLGPVDQDLVYSESVMIGEYKFLQRVNKTVMRLVDKIKDIKVDSCKNLELDEDARVLRRKVHATLQNTIEAFQYGFTFNTLIARQHELQKTIAKAKNVPLEVLHEAVEILIFSLAPFAPHLCEELWYELGGKQSIFQSGLPKLDKEALMVEEVEIVIQINGKIKARLDIAIDTDKETIEEKTLSLDKIKNLIEGKTPEKVIVVPNKLVNIII